MDRPLASSPKNRAQTLNEGVGERRKEGKWKICSLHARNADECMQHTKANNYSNRCRRKRNTGFKGKRQPNEGGGVGGGVRSEGFTNLGKEEEEQEQEETRKNAGVEVEVGSVAGSTKDWRKCGKQSN